VCYDVLYNCYLNISHSKKNSVSFDHKFSWVFVLFCQILMKFKFAQQIFDKCSNVKFHGNRSYGRRVVPRGRTDTRTNGETDVTKLVVAFRNFANTTKFTEG